MTDNQENETEKFVISNNEEIDIEEARRLAKEVLDNKIFDFVFHSLLDVIVKENESLHPNDVEIFRFNQSKKIALIDLYKNLINTMNLSNKKKPKSKIIL